VSYWRSIDGNYKENFQQSVQIQEQVQTAVQTPLNSLNPINILPTDNYPPDTAIVFYAIRGNTTGITITHVRGSDSPITITTPSATALPEQQSGMQRVAVRNFQFGHRLEFYFIDQQAYDASLLGRKLDNYINPAFVGHIYWNGQYWPSNLQNFHARAPLPSSNEYFGRLGCYSADRTDRNFYPANITPQQASAQKFFTNALDCATRAKQAQAQFFAIKENQCFIADTTYNMTALPDARCSTDNNSVNINKHRDSFDIYNTDQPLKLRDCGNSDIPGFVEGAKILRNQIGADCNTNNVFLYVVFEPRNNRNNAGVLIKPYCPDPTYLEFNPAGCNNPENKRTCRDTPKTADNYIVDNNECETPLSDYFNGSKHVNIPDLIQYIVTAYQISVQLRMTSRTKLKDGLKKLLEASCFIIQIDDEYHNIAQCMKSTADDNTSFNNGQLEPIAIGAIMKAGQQCQMDSEDYDHQTRVYGQQYSTVLQNLFHWSRVVMAQIYTS
jgi:hypothetical protein